MCNDYELNITWAQYKKALDLLAVTIPPRQSELNLRQANDIRINDIAPVMRSAGENTIELVPMSFGFPPPRPKASPIFNFRSEGRHFAESKRCHVPASAFFEFTGTRYPKAKHRFTLNDSHFMAIAGLWREGQGNQPDTFTMLSDAARTTPFQGVIMDETRSYRPLLQFIAGLIVTSVALVAATMSVMKDAWANDPWKLPLLSFLGWMSVTIFLATLAGIVIQWRRSYLVHRVTTGVRIEPELWEKAVAFVLPSIPGLLATWQLVRLAWVTVRAPMW